MAFPAQFQIPDLVCGSAAQSVFLRPRADGLLSYYCCTDDCRLQQADGRQDAAPGDYSQALSTYADREWGRAGPGDPALRPGPLRYN